MRTSPANTNASRKLRLLVGEKKPALRAFLASVFTAESYDVVSVATGIDLLDAVAVSLHPEFGSGAFALVISETSLLREAELQSFNRLADWTGHLSLTRRGRRTCSTGWRTPCTRRIPACRVVWQSPIL